MTERNDHNGLRIDTPAKPPPFGETLLTEIAKETQPVKPLPPPMHRALFLLLIGLGIVAVALMTSNLRSDLAPETWAVTYGPSLFEMLAGGFAFLLAMRWSVPGAGGALSRSRIYLGIVLGLVLLAALAAPHLVTTSHPGASIGACAGKGLPCMGRILVVGTPILLLALWLIVRGATVAATLAGALAGLGAGLIADGAIHLQCGAVDPSHTVTWHIGGVAILLVLGTVLGRILPKW